MGTIFLRSEYSFDFLARSFGSTFPVESSFSKEIYLSIIGCVVNGPGEAAQPDIGLTGGGDGNNLLYLSGIPHNKVASQDIVNKVVSLVESKAKENSN